MRSGLLISIALLGCASTSASPPDASKDIVPPPKDIRNDPPAVRYTETEYRIWKAAFEASFLCKGKVERMELIEGRSGLEAADWRCIYKPVEKPE